MPYFEELYDPRTYQLVWWSLIFSFLCLWLSLSNISFNRLRNEKVSVIHEMFIWFAVTSRHLALPFGLMFSSLGTSLFFYNIYGSVGEIQGDLDLRVVGVVTQIVVAGILYGGFLAGLGYFISSKYQHLIQVHEKNRIRPWAILVTLGLVFIWSILYAVGSDLKLIFSPISLSSLACIGFVMLVAVFSSNKSNKFQLLSKASFFGAIMCVVVGIMLQFKYPHIGIIFAFMGVFYGLVSYVSSYLFSYCSNSIDEVKPDLMSWHWIEIYAFLLFMFLAPATLRDFIVADEQALQIERLEQRIEQLENSQEINLKKQE
ncbi:hypothetical protein OA528_02910 [Gammaproteobacteria bacterium]|nr:hypothetical protein [Gammaproteobacteria bacterium]